MASVTSVVFTDDLDGRKADETVQFALDGAHYEIALGKKNAAALRKALGEFVTAARPIRPEPRLAPTPRRTRRASTATRSADSGDLAAIRRWAKEAGLEVADCGRISGDIRAQYESA